MRTLLSYAVFLLALTPQVFSETIDVDALPHKRFKLPNGENFEIITLSEVPYRTVTAEALNDKAVKDADVCFEAKFVSLAAPDKVKVAGGANPVVLDNPAAVKSAKEFKPGDNVWFCGTLRPGPGGESVQMFAFAAVRLESDTQRFANGVARLEKSLSQLTRNNQSAQRLELADQALELGRKIDAAMNQVQLQAGLDGGERLKSIATSAYGLGLKHKEAALRVLRPDAADAFFELSEQWREYLKNEQHARDLVLHCLQLDPEHPRATQAAEQRYKGQLEKYNAQWMTAAQAAIQKEGDAKNDAQTKEAQRLIDENFQKAVAAEVSQRRDKILKAQESLRTNEPKRLAGAIESLSDAIAASLDPGFGIQAIKLLADIDAPTVIAKGLNAAAHSRWPEVRRAAYEALAWRSLAAEDQAAALQALSAALKSETDPESARVAVKELVETGLKPGIGALIESLSTAEPTVRDEIVAGLKTATKQTLSSRDDWENWWKTNKN